MYEVLLENNRTDYPTAWGGLKHLGYARKVLNAQIVQWLNVELFK